MVKDNKYMTHLKNYTAVGNNGGRGVFLHLKNTNDQCLKWLIILYKKKIKFYLAIVGICVMLKRNQKHKYIFTYSHI